MAFMSLNGIDVSYDKKKQILKGLNLEVEEGELVSLLGPSGSARILEAIVVGLAVAFGVGAGLLVARSMEGGLL